MNLFIFRFAEDVVKLFKTDIWWYNIPDKGISVEKIFCGFLKNHEKGSVIKRRDDIMELKEKDINNSEIENLTQILDRGIDDMEAGHELPIDDAFNLVAELVEKRKRARA